MLKMQERLQRKLLKRQKQGNLRELKIPQNLCDFFSNDYLGLAGCGELTAQIQEHFLQIKLITNGSTGSRLLSGNSEYAMNLENDLASRFKTEKSLLFNSGYAANLSLISTIAQKGDTIIYDQHSHACIKEGARLSYARHFSFRHNDLQDLQLKLEKAVGDKFVIVESLYSMEGDYAPIADLVGLCTAYEAHLIIDEAHTTGWLGDQGTGFTCLEKLEQQVLARVHTFGKALGVQGGCVAGPAWLIDYLVNFARPFIYTTAMPLYSLAAIKSAFLYLDANPELVDKLFNNIDHFGETLSKLGWPRDRFNPNSPIQKIILGSNQKATKIASYLNANGMDVRPIMPPTVKEDSARIRICLHAYNSHQQIQKLIKLLAERV